MNLEKIIVSKIEELEVKEPLKTIAIHFLEQSKLNHNEVRNHSMRVALLMEAVAKNLSKDVKAAFFGGLLHDNGKIVLKPELFDGHNIDQDEYNEVKKHAEFGFETLVKQCKFTALQAGFHHNLYKEGYGLNTDIIPKEWCPATIAKLLYLCVLLSICDYVDAATHRKTQIKDKNVKSNLKESLYEKYQEYHFEIDIILKENKKLNGALTPMVRVPVCQTGS